MMRSHLSRLMGEKRVRVTDVARATGIDRNTLARLYYDRARRIDIDDLGKLCQYFDCAVGDLLEWTREPSVRKAKRGRSSRSPHKRE
jgi:putative transcriptional regulator